MAFMTGGPGNDFFEGGDENDTILGFAGNDGLGGGPGNDSLSGGEGNDVLAGKGQGDTLDGGGGFDMASYWHSSTAVYVDLGTGAVSGDHAAGDVLLNIENLQGSYSHNDTLIGNSGGNYIDGMDGNDRLYGMSGNDNLSGGGGDDLIDGGDGTDQAGFDGASFGVTASLITNTATGGAGSDSLIGIEDLAGSQHADSLVGNSGRNALQGSGGSDTLMGGDSDDFLQGGDGSDSIDGGNGAGDMAGYFNAVAAVQVDLSTGVFAGDAAGDVLVGIENLGGSNFDDVLTGDGAFNYIDGGAGGDLVSGLAANDNLNGGDGDDTLRGGPGDDFLQGGNDADLLDGGDGTGDMAAYFGASASVTLNLGTTFYAGAAAGDQLVGIENLGGSGFDDVITGDANFNFIDGGAGNDLIDGGGGTTNNKLRGSAGNDTLRGGAGSDEADYFGSAGGATVNLLTGSGSNSEGTDRLESIENVAGSDHADHITGDALRNILNGGLGNDTLLAGAGDDYLRGGDGADSLDGGEGTRDYAAWSSSSTAVQVNLATGAMSGGAAGDVLVNIEELGGSPFNDSLTGNDAANYLEGLAGNDSLYGLGGEDRLRGSGGNDSLDGGEGLDFADYVDAAADVTVDLNSGSGTVTGMGVDVLVAIENVDGSSFGDRLSGDAGSNNFWGAAGNDTLQGGDGADILRGGEHNDSIIGGTSDAQDDSDSLDGGNGDDTIDLLTFGLGYAPGAQVTVTGGFGQDTLKLPGAASNYLIRTVVGNNNFDTELTTHTIQTGSGVTLLVRGSVEKALFDNPSVMANDVELTGTSIPLEMMQLAHEVYGAPSRGYHTRDPLAYEAQTAKDQSRELSLSAQVRGWHAVSALELGMKPNDRSEHGTLRYSFIDGHYQAFDANDSAARTLSGGDDAEANALVLSGLVNGKRTLAVVFRGTDQLADWGNYDDFSVHFAKFAPLKQAIASYLQTTPDGYQQVLISGHSLGAGVAQHFLASLPGGLADVAAFTMGSPGGEVGTADPSLHFVHTDDLVPALGQLSDLPAAVKVAVAAAAGPAVAALATPVLGYGAGLLYGANVALILGSMETKSIKGSSVLIDSDVSDKWATTEHSTSLYVQDVGKIITFARDSASPFYSSTAAAALRAAGSYSGEPIRIAVGSSVRQGGTDDSSLPFTSTYQETVRAYAEDDYVLANQTSNDRVVVDAKNHLAPTGERWIDGGTGDADVLQLPFLQADYTLTTTPAGIRIDFKGFPLSSGFYAAAGYVATTSRIEQIRYADKLVWLDGRTVTVQSGPQATPGTTTNLNVDTLFDVVQLGAGSFNVTGSAQGDVLFLGAGNKTVQASAGDDFISITANSSNDVVEIDGGTGADLILGGNGQEVYHLDHAGDTVVVARPGGFHVIRSSVDRELPDNVEKLVLEGTAVRGGGNDMANTIVGTVAANDILGAAGDDTLQGSGGADTLAGGSGKDVFVFTLAASEGDDVVSDLESADELRFMSTASTNDFQLSLQTQSATLTRGQVAIDLSLPGLARVSMGADSIAGADFTITLQGNFRAQDFSVANGAAWSSIKYLRQATGTAAADLIGGTEEAEVVQALGGNDTVNGNSGNDTLDGGTGNDSLRGEADNDALLGQSGNDTLLGGEGNDTVDGGSGADNMTGGAGNDAYSVENVGDVVNELAGEGTDTVKTNLPAYTLAAPLENLTLTGSGNTKGTGNDLNNAIEGSSGHNTLIGGKGDDILSGQAGDDFLDGGTGADRLIGGPGNDTFNYGTLDRIDEKANEGVDTVLSAVNITLGATLENVTLVGSTSNVANGNNLNNVMIGSLRADTLSGGNGNDTIDGMAGDDAIVGGKGQDRLTGGPGNDTFRFTNLRDSELAARDLITDLQAGDKLDFSAIDANPLVAGDQAFVLTAAFSSQAGQLVLTFDAPSNRTSVLLDATGDGAADMALTLIGQQLTITGWLM